VITGPTFIKFSLTGQPDKGFKYESENSIRFLELDEVEGRWKINRSEKVAFNFGLMPFNNINTTANCSGAITPWNTIITCEEYTSKSNVKEAYGITLWSLLTTNTSKDDDIKNIIKNLIKDSQSWASPRAISTALLGLLNLDNQDSLENELKIKLHNFYFSSRSDSWEWFENYLVYANAIIPWALWEIYLKRNCKISFEIAKKTTDFLIKICQENNLPSPIGNNGWYLRNKKKALFDQQPIDAGYMVCCLEKAYYATNDILYLNWADKWYKWFWGNNIKNTVLVDEDFACYDALTPKEALILFRIL